MIYDNENIDYALRGFFIYLKKGVYSIVGEDDNVVMWSGDYYIDDLKKHRIWLDIVDIKDDCLVISGVYTTNFDNDSLRINLIKEDAGNNRETFSCDYFTYPQRDRSNVEYLGIPWKFVYNFEVSLKLKDVIHNKYTFEVTFEENNIQMDYTPRIEFRISSYFLVYQFMRLLGSIFYLRIVLLFRLFLILLGNFLTLKLRILLKSLKVLKKVRWELHLCISYIFYCIS